MVQPPSSRSGGNSAYFEKKGEVHELRQLLRSAATDRDQQKKRDAIKKVIAYMTLGIDVSPLFSEMVMASATNDLVQKKMVYLYLINYAESNSELAILAVNTLLKDCRDDDPMIRGLALRSLCSLNLLNMVEYLQPAVKKSLTDVNGYVRKTAVVGVLKLFHISRTAVLDTEIKPTLLSMVSDGDVHVVANVIHVLEEVLADEGGLEVPSEVAYNFLNRLNQFSEWGQCAVLSVLPRYQVKDEQEMFDIMNVLDALLKQSSSAVVLAVTKIFMDLTSNNSSLQNQVLQRLKAPLLTLMATATPELAYTVLVNIQALCEHGGNHPDIFGSEFKQFFCRYNEPSYIKNVKINILTTLADEHSSEAIVAELSEYVTDVDADISRRAIRAIGKIAVHIPSTAEMNVAQLTNLLELDIDYVSTEAAIVMKDLVRKYPMQFQRASGAVERCMKIVVEPEGKCALLWMLGEYGMSIEDAPYLLEPMVHGFNEEPSGAVRLEIITAAVKLFFYRPPEMQAMLGMLFKKAICETSHPDVRDRALLYYRLLQHSPEEAKRVICSERVPVVEFHEEMDTEMKERIFEEFNTLSTVFMQPAAKFVVSKMAAPTVARMQPPAVAGQDEPAHHWGQQENAHSSQLQSVGQFVSTDLLEDDAPPVAHAAVVPATSVPQASDLLGLGDLLDIESTPPPPPQSLMLVESPTMQPSDFQIRWGQLPQTGYQQQQMNPNRSATTAAIEDVLRQAGIHVIASGVVPGNNSLKFYFYARQRRSGSEALSMGDTWFFTELVIAPTGVCQCTVKAEHAHPSLVDLYFAHLWNALGTCFGR